MNGGKIMYPPLWLEINKVFWKISESFGWLGQMYFYKLIFLLCHLLTSWIIYKISKIFNSEGGLAKSNLPLLYLLNPLLLFEFAVNAHFDALMLLLIAGGLYLVFRKNTIIGLWLIATSILIKYTAIIFLPFVIGYLLYQAFENKKVKTTLIKIVIAGLASIALAAITFYPYWIKIGPRIFDGISRQSDWFINSVFATFYVPIISIYKAIFGHQIFSVSAKFLWISLILVGLAIFIRYCLKKASHKELVTPFVWLGASGLAVTLFLIFAQRSFWPWYATWALLPVALLKTKDKIWRLTTIFSLSSLAFYIPLAFLGQNSTNILDTWQILYGVVVFAPVLFYLRQI
ncbi:MAG: hypothetical protein NT141_03090 [candidate division WWE3 bacterium]|nr:hypothetical protein [candidate division WWE3 bacterium]